MAAYVLFGINVETIAQARVAVEKALSIQLFERDSAYHRGPYFALGEIGGENFEVKENLDPFEDAPVEAVFSDYRFLLYINNTSRSDTLSAALLENEARITLLRQEDFA